MELAWTARGYEEKDGSTGPWDGEGRKPKFSSARELRRGGCFGRLALFFLIAKQSS